MNYSLSEIISYMDTIAPPASAESWDNVGLQVGGIDCSIGSVLLTLDVSPQVVEEASLLQADLIISHHPLIFKPLSKINYSASEGKIIRSLISHNISLFTAHTNLDKSAEGTGRVLAETLGLIDVRSLSDDLDNELCMVVSGCFETPLSLEELQKKLKSLFSCRHIRMIGKPSQVLKVVVISGSGGSIIPKIDVSYDLIITGEVSYHDALSLLYQGRSVALLGHYVSEKPVMYHLQSLLSERFPHLVVNVSQYEGEPFEVF